MTAMTLALLFTAYVGGLLIGAALVAAWRAIAHRRDRRTVRRRLGAVANGWRS